MAVAAREPNVMTLAFTLFQKKVEKAWAENELIAANQQRRIPQICWTDSEKNRVFLFGDMERGMELSAISKQIQHELLCSMETPTIKVNYRMEVTVCHESLKGSSGEIPSLFFPIVITRDAKGAIDTGTAGLVSSQMISSYG